MPSLFYCTRCVPCGSLRDFWLGDNLPIRYNSFHPFQDLAGFVVSGFAVDQNRHVLNMHAEQLA